MSAIAPFSNLAPAPGSSWQSELQASVKKTAAQIFYAAGNKEKQESFALTPTTKITLKVAVKSEPGHAENVVGIVLLLFAAGAFTGILKGTGMVDAMAKSLVTFIPSSLGPYLAPITALISMPLEQKGGAKSRSIRQKSRWFQHQTASTCRRRRKAYDARTHRRAPPRDHGF